MADFEDGHARNKGRAAKAFLSQMSHKGRNSDQAFDILRAMKAKDAKSAAKDVAAHERKRTAPNPQLTPTGTLRRDGDMVGRAALKSSAQEKQDRAEKMKTALLRQRQAKQLGRER